jgi:hypothetical protein
MQRTGVNPSQEFDGLVRTASPSEGSGIAQAKNRHHGTSGIRLFPLVFSSMPFDEIRRVIHT